MKWLKIIYTKFICGCINVERNFSYYLFLKYLLIVNYFVGQINDFKILNIPIKLKIQIGTAKPLGKSKHHFKYLKIVLL